MQAQTKAEEEAAAVRSAVAKRAEVDRVAQQDAERDAGVARMDAELERQFAESAERQN
jgi:hypothetical protein